MSMHASTEPVVGNIGEASSTVSASEVLQITKSVRIHETPDLRVMKMQKSNSHLKQKGTKFKSAFKDMGGWATTPL
jgi:hypothetical protein